MPIYEYQCDDCGHRHEVIQRLADDPLTECEECGGTIRRLISAPAVQFKGSGWYVTDYAGRAGAEKPAAASDAKADAAPTGDKAATGTKKGESASKASE